MKYFIYMKFVSIPYNDFIYENFIYEMLCEIFVNIRSFSFTILKVTCAQVVVLKRNMNQ
jgi:hypothetical protein